MKKKTSILSYFTAIALSVQTPLMAEQSKTNKYHYSKQDLPHLFDYEYKNFQDSYNQLPLSVLAFEKMDFDSRMENQEFLRIKYNKKLFLDTLQEKILKENDWTDKSTLALEVIELGRPLATIKPNMPIHDIAALCGFKRICSLLEFKKDKKNKNKFFLDNKSDFYYDALSAELNAIERASPIMKVEDILDLRRTMLFEDWHYRSKRTSSDTNTYQQFITQQAQKRLTNLTEKQMLR